MGALVHFEIHAEDLARARKFYEAVLGWTFEKYPMPEEYWGILTKPKDAPKDMPGINGGLMQRKGPRPEPGAPVNGYVCTTEVADVDETVGKITANGGTIAMPKFAIPTMGWVAYGVDTEGNIFGVWKNDPNAA